MTFFDKKEDVIKIELTPYGRSMLSKGRLKPYCYAFFDDDILYDSTRGDGGTGVLTEEYSETKVRILENTPYMKPQTNYKGVESNYQKTVLEESGDHLLYPIGTNSLLEKKASAWNATLLQGEMSSSHPFLTSSYTGSDGTTMKKAKRPEFNAIPQINCNIDYNMSIRDSREYFTMDEEDITTSTIANDGTQVILEHGHFLLHLLEKNGFSHSDSFSVEVFLYDDNDNETLRRLEFARRERSIKNDLIVNEQFQPPIIDESMVEFYFTINVDKEISDSDVCKGSKRIKKENIYLGYDIKCPDLDRDRNINIYQTSVTDIEDCEKW